MAKLGVKTLSEDGTRGTGVGGAGGFERGRGDGKGEVSTPPWRHGQTQRMVRAQEPANRNELRGGFETIRGEPCFDEHVTFDIGGQAQIVQASRGRQRENVVGTCCLESVIENVLQFQAQHNSLLIQNLWIRHFSGLVDNKPSGCRPVVGIWRTKRGAIADTLQPQLLRRQRDGGSLLESLRLSRYPQVQLS